MELEIRGELAQTATLDDSTRLAMIYRAAFSRDASPVEIADGLEFLESQADNHQAPDEAERRVSLWADYCHTIINLKEFIYLL